jgi:hypothetical protein
MIHKLHESNYLIYFCQIFRKSCVLASHQQYALISKFYLLRIPLDKNLNRHRVRIKMMLICCSPACADGSVPLTSTQVTGISPPEHASTIVCLPTNLSTHSYTFVWSVQLLSNWTVILPEIWPIFTLRCAKTLICGLGVFTFVHWTNVTLMVNTSQFYGYCIKDRSTGWK